MLQLLIERICLKEGLLMKKFLLYALFLLPSAIVAIDQQIADTKPWRTNFKKIDHKALEKALGYNPGLELIEDNNPNVVHQTGPTLYIHGWLCSKNATAIRRRCNDSNKIPGDVIIFNFPDASKWVNES